MRDEAEKLMYVIFFLFKLKELGLVLTKQTSNNRKK